MTNHLADYFRKLSDQVFIETVLFERQDYTDDARQILDTVAVERGFTPEVIKFHRRLLIDFTCRSYVCRACRSKLILDESELDQGEFFCPDCQKTFPLDLRKLPRKQVHLAIDSLYGVPSLQEESAASAQRANRPPLDGWLIILFLWLMGISGFDLWVVCYQAAYDNGMIQWQQALNLAVVTLLITLLVTRHRFFPWSYVIAALIQFALADQWKLWLSGIRSGSLITVGLPSLMYWVPYILLSKRVKATFWGVGGTSSLPRPVGTGVPDTPPAPSNAPQSSVEQEPPCSSH